jgi:hypothetical protein
MMAEPESFPNQGKLIITPDQEVIFNDLEWDRIERHAHWRHQPKVEAHVRDLNLTSDPEGLQKHIMGTASEYAASLYLHEPMDWFTGIRGDGGKYDLVIGDQIEGQGPCRVDVKSTGYTPPYLKFHSLQNFRADAAILAHVEGRRVRLHAWITRKGFVKRHQMREFKKGRPVPITVPEDMLHMVHLKAWLYDQRFKDRSIRLTSDSRERARANLRGEKA